MRKLRVSSPFVAAGLAVLAFASAGSAEDSIENPEFPILIAPFVKFVFDGPTSLQLNIDSGGSRRAGDLSQVEFHVTGNVNAQVTAEPGGPDPFIQVPGADLCLAKAIGVEPSNRGEAIGYDLILKWPSAGRKSQTVSIDTDCPGGPPPAIRAPLFGDTQTGVLAIESNIGWNANGTDLALPGQYVGSVVLTVTAE